MSKNSPQLYTMMNSILFGLIVILALIVIYNIWGQFRLTTMYSSIDPGTKYYVLYKYPNRQQAADLLARVKVTMIKFLSYIKMKHHLDETDDQITSEGYNHPQILSETQEDVRVMMQSLIDNYNYEAVYENDPRNLSGETSYTVYKGQSIYLCIRSKENPMKLIDFNTLMFVSIHEAAHVANYNQIGHLSRFWTIFKLLLHEAVSAGVYDYVDYGAHPTQYVSMMIQYQPLNDSALQNLWE